MNKYKIGEIVSSTGIPPHTLKFYEREGILHPKSDRQTGYRYYDVYDLGRIMNIHRLRQYGFSVKEIQSQVRGMDKEALSSLFARQLQANADEIARLQRANQALALRAGLQDWFWLEPGAWEIREVPSFRFLAHCPVSNTDEPLYSVAQQMEDSMDTFNSIWAPLTDRNSDIFDDGLWGLIRFDRTGEALPQRWEDCRRRFPGGTCLVCRASGAHGAPTALARGREEVARRGLPFEGDAYSLTLNPTASPQGTEQNRILLFPLKTG